MITVAFVLIAALAYLVLFQGLVEATATSGFTGGGIQTSQAVTVSGENSVQANPTVVKAQAGTLTLRTSGTAGEITLSTGHGITTAQVVDLYWSGGKAYKATVGTVAGNVVPITAVAGGDALPVLNSAISVAPRNAVAFNVVGDNAQCLVAASQTSSGYVLFENGGTVHHVAYVTPSTPYIWTLASGVTNPIATDTVTTATFSTSATAADVTDMKATSITN